MKILLDPQIFNNQVFGGISRYYTQIFSNLSQRKNVTVVIPIVATNNIYFKESHLFDKNHKKLDLLLGILAKIGVSLRKKIRKANTKKTIEAFQNKNFDLFVPTYYDPYFLDFIGDIPFVLTVYDMTHELMPKYFIEDPQNVVVNKKIVLEKAAKIIAVSNNTKKDILQIYPQIEASKIVVIYHGNSISVNNTIQIDLPKRYILFVGERGRYKNFKFFINSIKEVLANDKDLNVLCAGGGTFEEDELLFIKELGLKNQIIHKKFKDFELGRIYKEALCFVFPSEYEGFGIPVVEAMACGCPIVLTNNSSFPEVAGNAGIYFELNNSEDLKEKVTSLIYDDDKRKEFSKKGLERSAFFNWEDAANQCFELYSEVISRKK